MGFTKAGDAPCRLMPRRWRAVFPPVISGMPRQTLVPGTSYIRTLQECCTTVWLVFSSTARMHCWVLPGSVQLQDYCIRPEKNGELFSCRYRKLYLPQTHPDMLLHPDTPIQPSKEMEDCFPVVIGIKYFLRPSQTCKCTREYLFNPPIGGIDGRVLRIFCQQQPLRQCHQLHYHVKDRFLWPFGSCQLFSFCPILGGITTSPGVRSPVLGLPVRPFFRRYPLGRAFRQICLHYSRSPQFSQLQTIEHVVSHSVNLAVPGLVKVSVVPLIDGMVVSHQERQ